jgi:hypothetical protein
MAFQMARRQLYIPILHIDTNLINARQKLAPVNQLEKWAENDVILINMSGVAHQEASADGNDDRTRKANQQIFTIQTEGEADDPRYAEVEAVLFAEGANDENQRNDVRIICEAAKYQAILVTNDGASKTQPGGILGNREKIRYLVQVMSPDEAVAFVREKIQERDEFNARCVAEFGGELPDWSGQD